MDYCDYCGFEHEPGVVCPLIGDEPDEADTDDYEDEEVF